MGLLESLIKNLIITPDFIGRKGEKLTAAKLGWVNFCGKRGKLLQNIYVPRGNGETTEIDLLYITQKGLFVIESKNYSGFIFGNETNRSWTSTLYAGKDWLGRKQVKKYQFYNPVWQNRTHIKFLKQHLNEDIKTASIIVFSERCELKSISISSSDVFVCNRNLLPRVIREIWDNYPDVLNEDQINIIFNTLLPLTNQDISIKEKHIFDIQSKLDNRDTCPLCGGLLTLRTAKQGPNAGHQFLGCSCYPQCRYTKNL